MAGYRRYRGDMHPSLSRSGPSPARSAATDRVAIGLLAAWCLNDAEELLTMAAGSREAIARIPARVPLPPGLRERGLSQTHVTAAIGLMGIAMAAASARGARTGFRDPISRAVLLGFGLHGIGHLATSAAARGYTSGVLTAPTVVIPFWLWARRALRREGIADATPGTLLAALTLTVPVMAAVHGLTGVLLGERSLGPAR